MPLSPVGHSNSAAYPVVQIAAQLVAVGDTKVVDPAAYKLAGLKELIAHADAPVSVGELLYPLLEFLQCFRMPFDKSALESKTQELTLAGFHHLAFVRVDHKLQAFFQILSNAA